FCKYGARLEDEKLPDQTLLELALIHRQNNKFDLLLQHGIHVDAMNRVGETALNQAAAMGNIKRVEQLLDAGANATAVENRGRRPFDVASSEQMQIVLLQAHIRHG